MNVFAAARSAQAYPKINRTQLFETEVPLPSLTTQETIVAEMLFEQNLVDANRELVTRFERKFRLRLPACGEKMNSRPGGLNVERSCRTRELSSFLKSRARSNTSRFLGCF